MTLVRVEPDDILTVTGNGTVRRDGSHDRWTVHGESPLRLVVPGVYHIEGEVSATLANKAATILSATLPRATEIVTAQRIITQGIRNMALQDKAQHFAERLKATPKRIEAALDRLMADVDDMEAMSTKAIETASAVVADTRASVAVVVDVCNQLTNGAPETGN